LSEIAQAQRVSVSDLKRWNKLQRSRIQIGTRLFVSPPSAVAAFSPSGDRKIHVVKEGEFPGLIAQAYSVPLDDLLRWNGLTKESTIRPGQRLLISTSSENAAAPEQSQSASSEDDGTPAADKPVEQPPPEPSKPKGPTRTHVVAIGESPWTIARKYGVKTADVLAWNNLTKNSVLQIGDKLVIAVAEPAPEQAESAAAPAREPSPSHRSDESAPADTAQHVHKVASGENPWVIAKKYKVSVADFLAWNNLSEDAVLQIGDEYIVHVPVQTQ
jgi:LysM repeat protein